MKRLLTFHFFLWLLITPLKAQEALVIAKIEGLPDQYLGEHILKAAYKQLNIPIQFKAYPAKRALSMARSGRVAGETRRLIFIEKSSPTLIRVPTALDHVDSMMFSRHRGTFSGMEQMRDMRLAYVSGIASFDPLIPFFKEVHPVSNESQVWQLIQKDRADVTSAGRIHGLYRLRRLGIANVYPMEPPRKTYKTYHYLHSTHKALVPRIDGVLKQMEASGQLAKLREEAIEQLMAQASVRVSR